MEVGGLPFEDRRFSRAGIDFFEKFGLDPVECFFIDDSPLNIDGARCAGMRGTGFFRDMARLRRELNEAGIPVRCE